MKGLILFWDFIKTSYVEVLENKKNYAMAFFALFFLGNFETLFSLTGLTSESEIYIFFATISTLMSFVVISQVVLIQKKQAGGVGELKYFVFTFLLYNLYYSFLFFAGLVLFIVPGVYALIFFSMAPLIAVLDDEYKGSFFKESRRLVRKNISLVAWASCLNFLMELSALIFSSVENLNIRRLASFLFSIPDSFITIVMTVATVKVYYHLKKE